MRSHHTTPFKTRSQRPDTSVGEGAEKMEPSYAIGGDVDYSAFRKEWEFLKILKTELLNDLAMPLQGIYVNNIKTNTN